MKKGLLTSLIIMLTCMTTLAQNKIKIYLHNGGYYKYDVDAVDSIKFIYEDPNANPIPDGSTFKPSSYPTPDAVDLGLPSDTKWASCNLGAESPQSFGGYFGWGDSTGLLKAEDPSSSYMGFYGSYNISGSQYDVVTAKYGDNWALPTKAQWEELFNSQYTETNYIDDYEDTGIPGWVITSKKTANSIFLPAVGYVNRDGLRNYKEIGYYWTSERNDRFAFKACPTDADIIDFTTSAPQTQFPIRGILNGSGSTPMDILDKDGKDPSANPVAGHAVDLGLSVMWADYNIGATSAEQSGDFFSWGSDKSQNAYGSRDYPNMNKTISAYTTVAKANIIYDEYDTAKNVWGGRWRMPTLDEMIELEQNCTWTWTTRNGVNGYVVTSKKDATKSIFFPAGGQKVDSNHNMENVSGYYWTSIAYDKNSTNEQAYFMQFVQTQAPYNSSILRQNGLLIRPVLKLK